jgi:hypothetical protein
MNSFLNSFQFPASSFQLGYKLGGSGALSGTFHRPPNPISGWKLVAGSWQLGAGSWEVE